jgi:hypothetical protein
MDSTRRTPGALLLASTFRSAWAIAAVLTCALHAAPAQDPAHDPAQSPTPVNAPAPQPPSVVKERYLVSKFPDKPSVPPSASIPLDPLGFVAPGAIYMGARNALASLDFLDEDHLLFTFRVPGLLHRDASGDEEATERQIRAVILTLPAGAVSAEAQWTVHDRARYVWPLNDGHFLLRDRKSLLEGDASLTLKPVLDFPGPLLWLDLDPAQKFLVTNSREPLAKPAKPGSTQDSTPASDPSQPPNQASTQASGSAAASSGGAPAGAAPNTSMDDDSDAESGDPDLVVRILHRDSGNVLLVSRARAPVHLPINSDGYLENLRGRATEWILNLSYFTGGSKMLGHVESSCAPTDDFLSEDEILVTACGPLGEGKLVAMTTSGRTVWQTQAPATEIWPQLVVAANGLRLAWETLDTDRPINSYAPMGAEDVKEQSVTVFDAATGDIVLVSPVTPILDVGGNVALSPSGRRVALLNAGAIQIFNLPAPPSLPVQSDKHPAH